MKKQLFILLGVLLATQLSAQSSGTNKTQAPSVSSLLSMEENASPSPIGINEVHFRTAKDFSKWFKDARDVQWLKGKKTTLAYFKNGDIPVKVAYTNKGRYLYTLKTLKEKDLPKSVRHLVKSNYYDYTINQVIEVNSYLGDAFVIKMSDENGYKTVSVSDDTMILLEDFLRAK